MNEKISVLIVEDEKIILEDILSMVQWEEEGFQVIATASNGKQGCVAHEKFSPQLIITDIRMPVMDGLAMMREIRQKDKAVSFIILSAYSEFEYAREGMELGSDSFLLKTDLSPELLQEALKPAREKILSRHSMDRLRVQHELFGLISSCVEPDELPPVTDELLRETLASYVRINPDMEECRKLLHRIILECYSTMGLLERFAPCPSTDIEEVETWLLSEYHKLCGLYDFIHKKKAIPVIINACEYIQQNYNDSQLQISSVAEHVGLSPGRLSVLFKPETGKTVNHYITEIRITEAKRLLRGGQYRIFEISEIVGYRTSQYFSQTFYKFTGTTPSAYVRGES